MKDYLLFSSLFSLLLVIPSFTEIKPVFAACVMVDVATQVAVRGSQTPADQKNNVTMESEEPCLDNVTTNVGTQVYTGPGTVQQTRNSSQYVGGNSQNNLGVKTPVIKVPVEVQVDVYSPSHDPNFLKP